jgi:hypothetical protein
MSPVKIIAAVVILAVAGFLCLAAVQPDEFRVSRSLVIDAPAKDLFAQIVDLEKSQKWSPWVEMDPEAKYEFEGPTVGEGATIHWDGEKNGKGSMTLTESRASEFAKFRLDFLKPMEATDTAEFTLAPAEGRTGTLVTWTMYGPNTFVGKVMGLLMNCETMIGDQFDKGLNNLKAVTEKK